MMFQLGHITLHTGPAQQSTNWYDRRILFKQHFF